MTVIQVRADRISHADVIREVKRLYGVEEISDSAAVTIAAWYQSPGSVGSAFAALASGAPVESADVLKDIAQERKLMVNADTGNRTLDMLATWIITKVREVEGR